MATKKKLLEAAAGAAGGAGLNIEEVFSTYLYDGNGSTQTITNGIDLSGEGGLVWTKDRDTAVYHALTDTERGGQYALYSNTTDAQVDRGSDFITSFNSNGYSIGADGLINDTYSYASWTFRKAPKFFDVVTYTGTGSATTISHNLGSVPACIIVKRTDSTGDWKVYHRAIHPTNNGSGYVINLNLTNARAATTIWSSTEPTSTEFSISGSSTVNASGGTYVAYLFAHNDGDGDFGPTGDQDVIKCGSYTGNGSADGPEIDLGFEPQWLLIKNATESGSSSTNWIILDNMRGLTVNGGNDPFLRPNLSNAEASAFDCVDPSATGFKVVSTSAAFNTNGQTFIYIAIRRGPMAVPTDATDVFAMDFATSSGAWTALSGFPIDFLLYSNTTSGSDKYAFSRLNSPNYVRTNLTNAETGYTVNFDRMDGIEFPTTTGDYSTWINWMWKRAPNFFDVVAYKGTGSARTVSHNLGVAPEMIWVKDRDRSVYWSVFHKDLGSSKRIKLNETAAADNSTGEWNAVDPTSTEFTVGVNTSVNFSGDDYIAYLFASVDGVSKVGSFTSDGTDLTIDCGFTSGARFILLRDTSALGAWFVWDTERGIVAGNDPSLKLNDTAAENTSNDFVDPHSSGFIVNSSFTGTGKLWIYYAIA